MVQKDPILILKNIGMFNITGEANRVEVLKDAISIAVNSDCPILLQSMRNIIFLNFV